MWMMRKWYRVMVFAAREHQPQKGDEWCSRKETVVRAVVLCGESAHDLGDDCFMSERIVLEFVRLRLTVKSNNTEDEDNGQGHDHDGVDLESGRLIGVEPYTSKLASGID
jgi:hypothetical protein